jgi:hypothetical protein
MGFDMDKARCTVGRKFITETERVWRDGHWSIVSDHSYEEELIRTMVAIFTI